jgi:hypothetical protein
MSPDSGTSGPDLDEAVSITSIWKRAVLEEGIRVNRLVVLGGGTAGTMAVNKLRRRLDPARWQMTVIDQDDRHLYQPGLSVRAVRRV